MSDDTPMRKKREPRRKVVNITDDAAPQQFAVQLSCGHFLYVGRYSRYAHCKTMGCPFCFREAEAR